MSTRRQFLHGAARMTAGAMLASHLPDAGRRANAEPTAPRTITLEARETRWELAPGRVVRAMAYDGQVPGPEIRVREGERLRVVLR
ncbi:MAG: multicopper oxidase family protein, partial [Candidatus Rokuibacteriota bacterium]